MTRTTLTVHNFRAFDHFEWSPDGLCLLSGANGAGKSTVLDAFVFLRVLFERGHEAAFQRIGARHFRTLGAPESEPVALSLRVGDILWKLRFPMSVAGLKGTFGEELHHGDDVALRAAMFQDTWFLGKEQRPLDEVRCCAKVLWDRGDAEWMRPLAEVVENLHVYKDYDLRRARRAEASISRQSYLYGNGGNVWSLLSAWKSSTIRSEGRFDWVMSATRRAFPELFSTIEIENGFPVLYPPGASAAEEGLPPERIADGLLTALLHLTAIAGARPGGIVAFDEVENHLHPKAIRSVLSSIRARAEEQGLTVILTTHSPVVMNEFRDDLDRVFVLDRTDPGRAPPVAVTELHTEEWLAQANLGTLYDRLAFGAPSDTARRS